MLKRSKKMKRSKKLKWSKFVKSSKTSNRTKILLILFVFVRTLPYQKLENSKSTTFDSRKKNLLAAQIRDRKNKTATEIIQIYVGIRAIKNIEYSHLAQLLDF
jgi:hypothetical protein